MSCVEIHAFWHTSTSTVQALRNQITSAEQSRLISQSLLILSAFLPWVSDKRYHYDALPMVARLTAYKFAIYMSCETKWTSCVKVLDFFFFLLWKHHMTLYLRFFLKPILFRLHICIIFSRQIERDDLSDSSPDKCQTHHSCYTKNENSKKKILKLYKTFEKKKKRMDGYFVCCW